MPGELCPVNRAQIPAHEQSSRQAEQSNRKTEQSLTPANLSICRKFTNFVPEEMRITDELRNSRERHRIGTRQDRRPARRTILARVFPFLDIEHFISNVQLFKHLLAMNKNRRQRLETIIGQLEDLRDEIELLREEEQEAFDNMPESLQDSEKGQQIEECADDLDTAYNDLDDVISDLQDIADR